MIEDQDDTTTAAPPRLPRSIRLRLGTLRASRMSLARIMRLRVRGEMDTQTFRDLCYAFNSLLGFWRSEELETFELRLAELERAAAAARERAA